MSENKILDVIKRPSEVNKEDFIPAVLYGPKRESTPLYVNQKDFTKLYREVGESSLITLQIKDEKKNSSALIYDIQRNSLTGKIVHVDFFEPDLKEKVETEVNLVFVGESLGVKESGGTLVKNFHTLSVKALPEKLPSEITIDISVLKSADDVITVKDIKLEKDVEILQEENSVIVMISRQENVDAELEKPIDEGEEPEIIKEKEEEKEKKEEKESDENKEAVKNN